MDRSGAAAPPHQGSAAQRGALHPLPLILGSAAILALVVPLVAEARPLLVWNASASSPAGLYLVRRAAHVRVGDMIVAWPPPGARRLAAARNYLPFAVPLVKRVAARAGDRVCAGRTLITVNRRPVAVRRAYDHLGRPLPWWVGCHLLAQGELLLLSTDAPLAFDGRYFGVTSQGEVIGRARLLWRR